MHTNTHQIIVTWVYCDYNNLYALNYVAGVCSGGVCKSGKLDGSGSERNEAEAAGAQRLEPQKHHVADTTQETPLSTHSQYRDAQTITDVCNSVSLAEVEIFSLLEETLPLYTLRAESVYGYDHDDWIHTPLVPPDTHTQLSEEQIQETLQYFLLCSERVEQMTKTYNDIDAVTRLLEEKERDLELAARIGQSLLQKNSSLAEQNQNLDEQLSLIREEVSQLHHELNLKDELLQFYTSAAEEEEEDEGTRTPPADAARGGPSDALQLKLRELQEENLSLRSEAIHLRSETESYEQKEQQLLKDCVRELRESSSQVTHLSEELWRKTEEASRQQEQITLSLAQTVELQRKSKTLAVENEELSQHLSAAKDAQRQLTVELLELQDKYSECVEMLREAHVELKHLRGRSVCGCMGTHRRFHPLGLYPMDSLAAEIEGNMRKELSLDQPDEEEEDEHNLQQRVFEKVKNIKSSSSEGPSQIPGSNQMLCFSPGSARSGSEPDNRTLSLLQENSTSDTHGGKCSGSADLQLALRRLSLRRQNSVSERLFFQRESVCERQDTHRPLHCDIIMSSRPYLPNKLQIVKPLEGSQTLQHWQQLARPHLGGILDTRPGVIPKGFRPLNPDQNLDQNQSPDHNLNLDLNQVYHYPEYEEEEDPGEQYFQSLPTTSSANRSIQSGLSNAPSALATPSSSVSLEPAFSESAVYYPGKCMAHTSSTYTFTTCKILHPSDELTTVTHSLNAVSSSLLSTPAVTPRMSLCCSPLTPRMSLSHSQSFTSLRDCTKTFSSSLGLVRLLQERGISAAVYRAPPHHQPSHTPSSTDTGPPQDTPTLFTSSSPACGSFLASRPARTILEQVAVGSRDCQSQTELSVSELRLVDKLKRLGVSGAGGGCGPLEEGLRRNRSYPAVLGASMAMKGPGARGEQMLLAPKITKQTSLK